MKMVAQQITFELEEETSLHILERTGEETKIVLEWVGKRDDESGFPLRPGARRYTVPQLERLYAQLGDALTFLRSRREGEIPHPHGGPGPSARGLPSDRVGRRPSGSP